MIRLRGHTLLCLQGFRGEGYSPGFTRNLADIHRRLAEYPAQVVQILDVPDDVCGACPHLSEAGCSIEETGSEERMNAQDRHVMRLLGLKTGESVPWTDVLDRIADILKGEGLPAICGTCRWLPLGYCREGIDTLCAERAQPVSLDPRPAQPSRHHGPA